MRGLLLSLVGCLLLPSPGAVPSGNTKSERELAADFVAAAPKLFSEWLDDRDTALQRIGLGVQGRGGSQCSAPKKANNFFTFVECVDREVPSDYSIDVVRTDSLLTPFVGLITVPVSEQCFVRNVIASISMSKNKFDAIAPSCIGHTYKECIAAGGKLAPKVIDAACTGGPGYEFSYQGVVEIRYGWRDGRWEFEEQTDDPPRSRTTSTPREIS